MKTIQKITLALVIIFTSLSYAQNSTQNWEDLEGTWKYQDEEIEFYLILIPKKVELWENKIEKKIIGYSRLIYNKNELYNRLNFHTYFEEKDIVPLREMSGFDNPEVIPDFNLSLNNTIVSGFYYVHNLKSKVNVKGEFNENTLKLHFTKPPGDVVRPDIVQKREAMYANHIPELPSTWVLERVTEDEIKE